MSFTSGTEYLDSLVKDYMKYRGFSASVKALETDLKNDKDKGFRADKIVQHLLVLINACDLDSLREYWSHLNSRFFCRCPKNLETVIKKYETNLYRYYIVRAYKNEKMKEIHSFFQKMSSELGNTPEWKDWYVLPYVPSVDSIPSIAIYFNRQWADTFLVSLNNLLSSLFASMPEPDFVKAYIADGKEIFRLENENQALKKKAISTGMNDTHAYARIVEKPSYIRAMGVPGSLSGPVANQNSNGKSQSDNSSNKRLELLSRPSYGISNTLPKETASTEMDYKIHRNNSLDSSNVMVSEKAISKLLPQTSREAFNNNRYAGSGETQNDSSASSSSEKINAESPPIQITEKNVGVSSGNSLLRNNSPVVVSSNELQYGINGLKQKSLTTQEEEKNFDDALEITYEKNITLTQTSNEKREAPALSEVVASHAFVNNLYAGEPTKRPDDSTVKDTGKDFGLPQNSVKNVSYHDQSFLVLSKDVFLEHHSSILQCKFDETGQTVGSIDNQGVVKVWRNEPKISTLATIIMNSPIKCLEWSSKPTDILYLGTANGTIRFFDTTKHASCNDVMIDDANSYITNIRAHPSGTSLVAASIEPPKYVKKQHPPQPDGILSIWDVHGSQVRFLRKLSCKNITCMEYNQNGKLLITGDFAGQITIYDMKTFIAIHVWEAHRGQVYSLQFSADETMVYSFGSDDQFFAWNVIQLTNRPEMNFHLPPTGVNNIGSQKPKTMRFIPNPEGNYVLIPSGSKGLIYKLDVKGQSVTSVLSLPEHKSPITAIDCAVNNTCGHCLTGSSDGKVQVTTILMHS